MIKTIADLLRELMVKEAAELDEEPVNHGPTIGAMYEGLARDILDRAIPAELDVRVVDGFIEGVDGILSPQIDAMIVTGEGRQIPYTSNFVWPIADVIAVFEVKKTLYADDLADAFGKLRTIKHMSEAHDQNGSKVAAIHAPGLAPASAMTSGACTPSTISAFATACGPVSTSAPASR